jgi:hypothetical protein
MTVSPEEFFMYLIIALIVAIPLSARLYRYLTAKRTARMMDEQFERPPGGDRSEKT